MIKPNMRIAEIIKKHPAATEVLTAAGIDFCCGGHRISSEVPVEKKIDGEAIAERAAAN